MNNKKDRFLYSIDFATEMKRIGLAGVVDVSPYGEPYYLLTVPLQTALDQMELATSKNSPQLTWC